MTPNNMRAEQIAEGLLLLVICIVALLGNISIWIIILSSRSLRTITNVFLLVLSGFDILVSSVNMPVTVLTIFTGEWIFADDVCIGLGFSNMVTLCGSVLSLCNISINRYIMVCNSTKFSNIYTKRKTALMIFVSIIVTIGVSLPPLLGWCEYSYNPEQYICFANWPQSLSYALFMIFCCFGIPLTVMVVCNYKIYQQVKQSRSKVKDSYNMRLSKIYNDGSNDASEINSENVSVSEVIHNRINEVNGKGEKVSYSIRIVSKPIQMIGSPSSKASSDEIRLARVLGIVVLVFFVCWFPYCISMILSIAAPGSVHHSFYMPALLIGYFNSCCNPIIYGILNKRFTKGFKRLCCFWRRQLRLI